MLKGDFSKALALPSEYLVIFFRILGYKWHESFMDIHNNEKNNGGTYLDQFYSN